MSCNRQDFTFRHRSSIATVLFACALALAATAARADDAKVVPVAPPEGAELAYDVPVPTRLVPEVLDLKTRFDDVLSDEFTAIAEDRTTEDITALIDAGRELAVATARVNDSIRAIGELDVTFGIEGISRIIPAESALRDTLFGWVVWHEFSSTPARGMMRRFESQVDRVTGAGPAAGDLAEQLAAVQSQLSVAVKEGDASRIAELTPGMIERAARIDAVCTSAVESASRLVALVDSLSEDSGELLQEKWVEARDAVVATATPAAATGPALASMSDVMGLVVELGEIVGMSSQSVDALSSAPSAEGMVYVPWTVFRNDYEMERRLEYSIIGRGEGGDHAAGSEQEGQGAEGEGGHDHGHESAYVGGAVSEETRARLTSVLPLHVEANALLAQRAVEYTSTVVGYAEDAIEKQYLALERYSDDLGQDEKAEVLEKVDRRFRENMEFGVARMLITAARDEMKTARREHGAGPGHESQALYHYQNVWLHCLNAGASAGRAEDAALNRK